MRLRRFSDAGTHDTSHALRRPASEKRQGTKSRVGNGGGAAIPADYNSSLFARDGGLLSYGGDQVDTWRRTATYVDRILRGAKPGDLPVQFPTKFEMVVNLKTAKALGLAVPPSIMLRADEVIE